MKDRPTFSQLWLDEEMRALAKKGFEKYWNRQVVDGSMRARGDLRPEAREAYYRVFSSRVHWLISADAGRVRRFRKTQTQGPYTKKDILWWLMSIGNVRRSDPRSRDFVRPRGSIPVPLCRGKRGWNR